MCVHKYLPIQFSLKSIFYVFSGLYLSINFVQCRHKSAMILFSWLEPFQLWKWYCCCGKVETKVFRFSNFGSSNRKSAWNWSTVRVFFVYFIYWRIRAEKIKVINKWFPGKSITVDLLSFILYLFTYGNGWLKTRMDYIINHKWTEMSASLNQVQEEST